MTSSVSSMMITSILRRSIVPSSASSSSSIISSTAIISSSSKVLDTTTTITTTTSNIINRNFSDVDGPKQKQRKVKKKAKKGSSDQGSGASRDLNIIIQTLNAPISKPPSPTKEEHEQREEIMKNYTIGRFKKHNELNHDLNCKLRLKQHAIRMLPRNDNNSTTTYLKDAALSIDDIVVTATHDNDSNYDDDNKNGPPPLRMIPTWTPPIKDFNPNVFFEKEE